MESAAYVSTITTESDYWMLRLHKLKPWQMKIYGGLGLGSLVKQQRQLLEFDAEETHDRRRLPEIKINCLGGFANYSVQLDAEPSHRIHNSVLSCTAAQRQRASLALSTRFPEGSSNGRHQLPDGN
jgi:hypothetical protein